MKKKIFLLGLMIISIFFLFYCKPPEYMYVIVTSGGEPPVYYPQEDTLWCGAACLQMYGCFKYYPSGCRSQSEIMNLADYNDPYGLLDQEEIYNYMSNYLQSGKFTVYYSGEATFLSRLKTLIQSTEPFICYVGGGTVGHWIFVDGYRIPWDDPYSDPVGIVYADPAKICDKDNKCYGVYYDVSTSVFFGMTGSTVGYVGMAITPKIAPDKELVSEEDPYQPPPVYTNYYNYLSKEAPGSDGRDLDTQIPFADGSNGLDPELVERIIQASDSVLGVWGVENLVGLDPDYAKQFDGAHAYGVEFVTNTAYLRYGDPGQFPCDIYCGGQEFFSVAYIDKT